MTTKSFQYNWTNRDIDNFNLKTKTVQVSVSALEFSIYPKLRTVVGNATCYKLKLEYAQVTNNQVARLISGT